MREIKLGGIEFVHYLGVDADDKAVEREVVSHYKEIENMHVAQTLRIHRKLYPNKHEDDEKVIREHFRSDLWDGLSKDLVTLVKKSIGK